MFFEKKINVLRKNIVSIPKKKTKFGFRIKFNSRKDVKILNSIG